MSEPLTEKDFPATYQEADFASLTAQKNYLRMFLGVLTATIAGTAFAWAAKVNEAHSRFFAYDSAVCVTSALVLTLLLKERRYETSWYMGRAIAESVKTRAWSFMMRAAPYNSDSNSSEMDRAFIKDIANILKERGPLILVRGQSGNSQEISDTMCRIRKMATLQRKELYLSARIVDQKQWYSKKAAISRTMENRLFLAVIGSQVAAVCLSFYALIEGHGPNGFIGVIAALSTGSLAWLQVKKYQETAQAYSVTAIELGLAEAIGRKVTDEAEFAKFVEESESAISREHTLWIARRTSK